MFEKLVFLAILALVQARPEGLDKWGHLEHHELCPPAETHWLLPHEYDCTLFYYCEYGLKWKEPRECAEGTEFSYELQVCVHPDEANCNLPGSPTSAAPSPTNAPTTTAAPTNAPTTSAAPTHAPTAAPIEVESGEDNGDEDKEVELLPNGCPADYTVEQLYPHADCGKFYQCAHGEKVEMSCPEGEHFNAAEEKCDWPANAGCEAVSGGDNGGNGGENNGNGENSGEDGGNGEGGGENGGEDGGNGDNGGEDSGNGGEEEKEVELLPNGCPADYTVDQLYPHADCGKFYQCAHGEKIVMSCPEGQHFNVAEEKCDWPANAGCDSNIGGGDGGNGENGGEDNGNGENGGEDGGNGENGGEDGGDGGNGENGGEDGGNGGNGSNEVELLPNGCPADYTVDQLYPHADCGKFYQCAHGEKVEMSCPEGEHFNVATQACDWPANAGCDSNIGGGDGGNGENGGEDNGNGENGGEDGGNGEHGGEDGGDGGNGENGGEDGGNGGNGSNEVELLPNGCPADYTVDQLYPHADCGKFYQCAHGEKVVMSCPEGEHFNVATQACDWPANAGCDSNIGGGDGGNGENGGEDNGNGENGGEDGGNGEHGGENGGDGGNGENGGEDGGNGGNGSNEVELLPNGCPADYTVDQLYPHADCGKFYQCAHGEKVEMSCPEGEHFNVATQACDWPANAGCDSNIGGGDGGNVENGGEDNGNGENGGEDGGNGENGVEDNGNGENGGEDNGNGENGGADGGNGSNEVDLLPNGCPSDENIDLLLPHADCGKFYQCAHGEKFEMSCPEGEHFNVALQACDWPANAGCASGGDNGSGDNGSGDNGSGDNGSGDNGSGDNGSGDTGSGDGGNGNGDGGDGNGDGGDGNGDSGNGNGDGDNNGGEDTGNGENGGGNGDGGNGDGDNVELLPNGCPADFSVHHLLPHEDDCGKFYYCVWGELVERKCSPGTHFNPKLQICDWPWNAGCESGDNGGGNGDGGNGNGNRCVDGCNVLPWAHATDCDKFWQCNGEMATLIACSEGLKFNAVTRTCDFASNVSC